MMKIFLQVSIILATCLPLHAQFTISIWGDNRNNRSDLTQKICEYLKDAKDAGTIDAMLHVGDMTSKGTSAEFATHWGYPYTRDVFVRDFAYMVTSNHDSQQGPFDANVCPFNPNDGPSCYYFHVEWDIPGSTRKVHLFAVDGQFTDVSPQMSYFNPILDKIDPDDWICLLNHGPAFPGTYKGGGNNTFVKAFISKGLDFHFAGHAHVYRRTHVLNADGKTVESTGGPGTSHVSPANSTGVVDIVSARSGTNYNQPVGSWGGNAYAPSLDQASEGLITIITFEDNVATLKTIIIDGNASRAKVKGTQDEWTWERGLPSNVTQTGPPAFIDEGFTVFTDRQGLHVDVPFDVYHTVEITNLNGELVKLFKGEANREYTWKFEGSPGLYVVRLRLPGRVMAKKAILVK